MEKFGIEPALLVAQIINFGVFFFVFSKYIAKPLIASVKKEKAKEAEKERLLHDLEKRDASLKEKEVSLRKEVARERDETIAEAKKTAEELKKEIIAQAEKDAESLLVDAQKQISAERTALEDDLKKKTIDLSLDIVNKALKDYLTPDVQRKLTSHIVETMGVK